MADLHIHTLTVRSHRISCDSPVLVQHGMGHDAIMLDLDAEWDGLSVRLVLGPCGSACDVIYEGEPVVVPAATLADAGWLPVSVVGHGSDGTVRVTTERCDHLLRVVESGCVDGSEPVPDPPDLLGQLVEAAERADTSAEAADKAAASATSAAGAATEAAGRVDAAVESATKATKAATDAAASATSAAKQASDAAEIAERLAEDIPAYVTAAKQAATKAARAASDADGSATAAGKSASAAAGSAERAAGSAGAAQGSAEAASGSAQQAATRAGEAAGSATAASESAEAAQEHAQSAQQSAAEAESWADAAQVSAGNVLTGTASGPVAHADDTYAAKPREMRIAGRTVRNLWPVINLSNGTVTTDETGLITVNATPTTTLYANAKAQGIEANKSYTLTASNASNASNSTWTIYVEERDLDGAYVASRALSLNWPTVTFTTAANCAQLFCMVIVYAGYSANLTTRVMLVEGTEAPDCFTPTGVHGVEPEGLVVAGRNLLPPLEEWSDETYAPYYIRYAEVNIPPGTYISRCDGVPDGAEGNFALWLRNDIPDNTVSVGAVLAWGYQSGPHVSTNPVTIDKLFRYVFFQSSHSMAALDLSQFKFQLELGSIATAYEPPNVTEVTLPETDPLMSVKDKADVLTVTQDGEVSVERHVERGDITEETLASGYLRPASGDMPPYFSCSLGITKYPSYDAFAEDGASYLYSSSSSSSRYVFIGPKSAAPQGVTRGLYRSWSSIIFWDEEFTDAGQARQFILSGGGSVWARVPASVDQLGTVQTPQLPAPTFNAYATGGYVPGDTNVDYERDVNIAYAELEAKIAALTVAQATS